MVTESCLLGYLADYSNSRRVGSRYCKVKGNDIEVRRTRAELLSPVRRQVTRPLR